MCIVYNKGTLQGVPRSLLCSLRKQGKEGRHSVPQMVHKTMQSDSLCDQRRPQPQWPSLNMPGMHSGHPYTNHGQDFTGLQNI